MVVENPLRERDNVNSLNRECFFRDGDNEDKVTRRVSAKGEFRPTGLITEGKITHINIDRTTWKLLPATPLENRNTLKIVNRSASETIYLEFDNTVATGDGDPIGPGVAVFYDITDDIPVYGSTGSGTVKLTIVEGA